MKKLLLVLAATLLMLPVSAEEAVDNSGHEFTLEGDFCYNRYMVLRVPEDFEIAFSAYDDFDPDRVDTLFLEQRDKELPECQIKISTGNVPEYDPAHFNGQAIRKLLAEEAGSDGLYIESKEYNDIEYIEIIYINDWLINDVLYIDLLGYPQSGINVTVQAAMLEPSADMLNKFEDLIYSIEYPGLM